MNKLETLNVNTDVILIGENQIKNDNNTIYEITLTDNRTYYVIFDNYAYYESPSIVIVFETCKPYGVVLQTESIYLNDISDSIVKCIETDRKVRSDEE